MNLMLDLRIAKSGGAGKKLSPYNKFMKTELARLKESEPDMAHMDRCVVLPLFVIFDNVLTSAIGSNWRQEIGKTPRSRALSANLPGLFIFALA